MSWEREGLCFNTTVVAAAAAVPSIGKSAVIGCGIMDRPEVN